MAGTTISTGYTIGITFSAPTYNPVYVAATGTIDTSTGDAIYGKSPTAWTITNAGLIESTGSIGVYLQAGGAVTNLSGGTISGSYLGVYVHGGTDATVSNAGLIEGSHLAVLLNAGTAANDRLIVDPGASFVGGVYGGGGVLELASGASTGTISGIGSAYTAFSQIDIDTGATWVLNGSNSIAFGVSVTNGGTLIVGGTLINSSYLPGPVTVASSGYLYNALSHVIDGGTTAGGVYVADAGQVVNNGTISGSYGLSSGGNATLRNAAYGVITGHYFGIDLSGTVASVLNAGTMTAAGQFGAYLSGGTLTNTSGGFISGAQTGVNFGGNANEYAANQGIILGGSVALLIGGPQGMVVNSGTMVGTVSEGLALESGGTLINQSGGYISGGSSGVLDAVSPVSITNASGATITSPVYGVRADYGGTLVNAGAITGGVKAVVFAPGQTDRVVIDPGASFNGIVDGGNTIGAAYVSTLELASGASAGTLSGAGSQLYRFADINIDAAATWTLTSDMLGGGYSIYDNGSLTNTGSLGSTVTLGTGALLSNAASGTIDLVGTAVDGGGDATVVNAGSIAGFTGAFSSPPGYGVRLGSDSLLINQAGGEIVGGNDGIDAQGGPNTTIYNAGQIFGGGGIGLNAGVILHGSGLVTNAAGGRIFGDPQGILTNGGADNTVVNAGTIDALGYGIRFMYGLLSVDRVDNLAGGTITGYPGIQFTGAGTVENAGSISGGVGYFGGPHDAIQFAANNTNRLIVDPGASFSYKVDGANAPGSHYVSTLELTSGSSAGTLSGLGTQFVNFAQTTIDAGASWNLSGSLGAGYTLTNHGTLALTNAQLTISGALVNDGGIVLNPDTLSASYLTGTGGATIEAGGVLDALGTVGSAQTISFSGGGYLHLYQPTNAAGGVVNFAAGDTIDLTGINPASVSYATGTLSFTGGSFPLDILPDNTLVATASSDGTELTAAACYLRGTRIETPEGAVPVEELAIGDHVLTLFGESRPIKWIGRRGYAGRFAANRIVQPIRIHAGALGDDVPRRDLYVSPLHALFIDDVLVPAEKLVNGVSIVRCTRMETVEYFHIELETHDVLLAEGAPAESFADCDNRAMFHNGAEFATLYPADDRTIWSFCAPRVDGGDGLARIRWKLQQRFGWFEAQTTTDPALRLIADGAEIEPEARDATSYRFRLARPPRELRIVSRVADDQGERLGVCLSRIVLSGGDSMIIVGHHDASLCDGFHAAEATHRWTDGNARVPAKFLACFDGAVTVELELLDCALAYASETGDTVRAEPDADARLGARSP